MNSPTNSGTFQVVIAIIILTPAVYLCVKNNQTDVMLSFASLIIGYYFGKDNNIQTK
jgi:hypothetical protein